MKFGVTQALGARESLFALNMLLQKCKHQRKKVYINIESMLLK